jgi:hypothetical protein
MAAEQATLIIERETGYADRLRSYRILIDGKQADTIRAKERKTLTLSPGRHSVQLGIDWATSNSLDIVAHPGDTFQVACGNNAKGWRLLLLLLYVTVWRHKYLWLRQR